VKGNLAMDTAAPTVVIVVPRELESSTT